MSLLVFSFLASLFVATVLVRSAARHAGKWGDHQLSGPQKFHTKPVPRIGGVAILAGVLVGAIVAQLGNRPDHVKLWLLLAAGLPAFMSGVAEDLTKNVSPRRRLFFTATSAALAIWWLDAALTRTDIPGMDLAMPWAPFAIAITIFVVTGVANAVNIIDGFNGLAAMCVLMMLMAIAYVAFQVGDMLVLWGALTLIGAVAGFFVWNFPAGLIFLGDGGAYFLGFMLAELGVLLLHRNPQVSPLFILLLCAYPVFETLFSIYRKKWLRGISPGVPDGIHLHMLIYKRLMRLMVEAPADRRKAVRNSMTSPYLWLLCLASVVPAVLWWNKPGVLACFLLLFIVCYVLLYWSIVRFKTPKWLVFRR